MSRTQLPEPTLAQIERAWAGAEDTFVCLPISYAEKLVERLAEVIAEAKSHG